MEKVFITDKQGNKVLPKTHVSAVYDDEGNDLGSHLGAFEDEVRGLVDTPHQEYVTVATYASLPASGSKDTIYRVSNYNGSTSQVDTTSYSEYAWDGSQYIFLCVKSQIDEVFDITVYNNNTKYADLTAALGSGGENIPESLRKGGMSVKYVQTSDNKYVQYRLMSDSFSTTVANWQGVEDEPTAGSNNLVKSGGIAKIETWYSKNKFDKNSAAIEKGVYRYYETGNKVINADFECALLPLEIGKTYVITGTLPSYHICFYNGDVYLSGGLGKKFTVPSDCNIVYVSLAQTEEDTFQIEESGVETLYKEFGIIDPKKVEYGENMYILPSLAQRNNAFSIAALNTIIPFFTIADTINSDYSILRIYKNAPMLDGAAYVTGFQFMKTDNTGFQDFKYCIISNEPIDLNPNFVTDKINAYIRWDLISGGYKDFSSVELQSSAYDFNIKLKSAYAVDGIFGTLNGNQGNINADGNIENASVSYFSYSHKLPVGNAKYLRLLYTQAGDAAYVSFYNKNNERIFYLKTFISHPTTNVGHSDYIKIPDGTKYFRINFILKMDVAGAINYKDMAAILYSDKKIVIPEKTILMHEVYDSNDKGFDYRKSGTITPTNDGIVLSASSKYTSGYWFAATNRTMRLLCKFGAVGNYLIGTDVSKIAFVLGNDNTMIKGVAKNFVIDLDEWYIISFTTNYNYENATDITISKVGSDSEETWNLAFELSGYPYIETQSGVTFTLKQIDVVAKYINPYIMFYGDSISALAHSWDWETLIEGHITKPCVRSALGGTQITKIAERIQQEAGNIKPKYVFIGIGTNGANTYQNLSQLVTYLRSNGIEPYLNHVPCGSKPNDENIQIAINAVIDQVRTDLDVKGIDFDKATSLAGDGLEIDPVCFPQYEGDYLLNAEGYMLHPGAIGCKRMLQQAFIDAPELFNS